MHIYRLIFNAFQENTYILAGTNNECFIIDPGCSNPEEENALVQFIQKKQLTPVKLINTHGHVDHILGNYFVINKYNIPLLINAKDQFLIEGAKQYGAAFGFQVNTNYKASFELHDGDILKLGTQQIRVLETPGHSPGSISLYSPDNQFVVVGDVLFKQSIGRTDLPQGNYDVLMNSIFKKIVPLGDQVTVFSGHGPETTIGEEMIANPFLIEHFNRN